MADLKNALANETDFNITSIECRIGELRREASRRLDAISQGQEGNLLLLCRSIFDILTLQDDLNRERHRLTGSR
jgi:hypothetical protein